MDLDLFCQLFYASHYIPMALLQRGGFKKTIPAWGGPCPFTGRF